MGKGSSDRVLELYSTLLLEIWEVVSALIGETINATISLGISSFPSHRARSKEELVRMADLALYHAKGEGRNRVSLYDPSQG